MRVGVLCSGNLGFEVLQYLLSKVEVIFVMTDKKSNEIINYCHKNKIEIFTGNPRNGKSSQFLNKKVIDILISINYLFLIDKDIIALPKRFSFNIHGSLLPKYRGRTPHVWAIINNEKKTGITAHLIDEGCDTGDIIRQIEIPIEETDTGADILLKFNQNYITLIDTVIEDINNNAISLVQQNNSLATYYGKRTPDDGIINWDWHKERIYNWIRAQAFPYPGAYTYYEGNKVILDKISFSEHGFDCKIPNGTILALDPYVIVKTPNGAVNLEEIRNKSVLKLIAVNKKFEKNANKYS